MISFLETNGIYHEEIIDFGLSVAAGEKSCEQILEWIIAHKIQ